MAQPRRKEMIRRMVADLELLPEERLEEVRDFVDFLRRKAEQPRRGSAQALLDSFGSWDGPPGELDRLVEEAYEARHREEESADQHFAAVDGLVVVNWLEAPDS